MRTNRHDGFCAACATHVEAGAGALTGSPGAWRTWCVACSPRPPARGDHDGWHRLPLASLDLETTGVDPHVDRVVSYALLEGDREITGFVNPGIEVPVAASSVHGMTDAMLADAPPAAEALAGVLAWVQDLVERRVGLVVFNACYDLTMLRAEAERYGLAQPDWSRLLVIDPYVVDWGVERGGLGRRRLVDVAAYYDVRLDDAHEAAADARASLEVAMELAARHKHIGALQLDALMERQRGWYAERAEDWNSHARTAGRALDDPAGWPLASGDAAA